MLQSVNKDYNYDFPNLIHTQKKIYITKLVFLLSNMGQKNIKLLKNGICIKVFLYLILYCLNTQMAIIITVELTL